MRIALDATYSLGESLSGVGVYSREILHGLTASGFAADWEWFYRSRPYWRSRALPLPRNVKRRLLTDSWGSRSAALFHGLNQRLPGSSMGRRFKLQVATFHDLFVLSGDYSTPDFRARFVAQAREAAAAADMIVAVSGFTARQVEGLLSYPRARIRVVHHGVLPRPAPASVPREKIVLCVGAIQRRKNQAALVRAFRAAPHDWRLVLAGSQGYEAAETVRAIEESTCRDRIVLTGYISDAEIGMWYARAAIFAFPSLDEGFGMPALEAMAAGVPVITSDCSALKEISTGAALMVDPRREDNLADAIALLTGNEDLRLEWAALGRKRAAEFTWARAVTETTSVYRELLGV